MKLDVQRVVRKAEGPAFALRFKLHLSPEEEGLIAERLNMNQVLGANDEWPGVSLAQLSQGTMVSFETPDDALKAESALQAALSEITASRARN